MIEESTYKIKLIDFGLSRALSTSSLEPYEMSFVPGSGKGPGALEDSNSHICLRYMAPEVFLQETYSLSADVYSYGLVIYYLFCSELPFQNLSIDEIRSHFNTGTTNKLLDTGRIPYLEIRQIVERCICREPGERITMEAVCATLETMTFKSTGCCVLL